MIVCELLSCSDFLKIGKKISTKNGKKLIKDIKMKVFFLIFACLWSLSAMSGIKSKTVDFKEKELVKNGISVFEYFKKTEILISNSNKYSVESGFYVKDYKGEIKA